MPPQTPIMKSPVMSVGRYAGVPVDQLPNSYLRWMITQDFPKEILDAAKYKLEKSEHSDIYLAVSRHAIDMFSKRFLFRWVHDVNDRGDEGEGLGTYIARCAEEAWVKGVDVSKHRHQDDGIVKEHLGIKWVFRVSPNFPDYKDVITVMSDADPD